MPDYQKGKIYKVVSNTVEGVYYGSTADELWSRFGGHKNDYNQWKKGKRGYCTSYKLIEAGDAEIILIEKYPCNDKIELKARERWYIENNDCLNKCVPNRTAKEWREANREKVLKHHKEYYQDNKEKILKRQNEYNQDNKEKIKEYRKLTFQCLCDGKQHNLHNRPSHFRSQYHITNLKEICDIHGIDPNDIDPRDFK